MPIQPLPDAPQRNESEGAFVQKANAFVAALQPFGQQVNQAGQDVLAARNATLVARDEGQAVRDETLALRNTTLTYRNNALDASASATNSATDAAASRDAVINNQEQAGAILGAGIGTTFVDDGDLFINYIEPVTNVSINASGNLSITYA